MKEDKLQSGTDPPFKSFSVSKDWVLLGDTVYSVEELERDNPFNP